MRDELLHRHGELALSVDLRKSATPGVHYVGDVTPLLNARQWARAFLWPLYTHQTISDKTHAHQKRRDG
eukprot:1788622-Pleurochrysis_carterae.AAC.1